MKNRIFAIILACLTLLSSLYIPSFAAEEGEANDFVSTLTEVVEACGHENGEWVKNLKNSNCKENVNGIAKYHCDDCGEDYYEQLPLHTSAWLELQKPTCGEPGKKIQWCEVCEQTIGDEVAVPATGEHDMNEIETIVDPDCENYGYAIFECSVCGYADLDTKRVIEDLAPLNHPEAKQYEVSKDADCASNATVTTYCGLCNEELFVEDLFEISKEIDPEGIGDLTLKAKEHANVTYVHVPTEEGSYHNEVCADCKTVLSAEPVGCEGVTIITSATCNKYFTIDFTCNFCKNHSVQEFPQMGYNPDAHVFDKVVAVKPATCTSNGIGKEICTACGATGDYIVIPAGHTWGTDYDVTPATCDVAGKATHACTVCEFEETYDIPALGHDYQLVTVEYANCGKNGKKVEMCVTCSTVKEGGEVEIIPASGNHVPSATESTSDATCTESAKVWTACSVCDAVLGEVEEVGEPLGHVEDTKTLDATCEENARDITFCTVCQETLDEVDLYDELLASGAGESVLAALKAFGHDLGDPTSDKNGKHAVFCKTCKEQVGDAVECSCDAVVKVVATCQRDEISTYTCADCGYTYDAKSGEKNPDNHEYAGKPIKPATCTTNGISKEVCVCGVVGTYYVVPASHTWGEPYNVTAPTCDTKGAATHACTVCGETQSYEIDALGHNTEIVTTKQPGCGVAGSKIEMCLVCEKTFGDAIAIDPTGEHVWATVETVLDATCTEPAKVRIACTVCDATKPGSAKEVGEPLGHVEVSQHYEADCDKPEREVISCSVCNEILDTVDLSAEENGAVGAPAKGHTYGETYTPAANNKHTRTCSTCGDVETTSCDWQHIGTTPATCQDGTYKTYECSVCKKKATQLFDEAKDPNTHIWGEKIIKAPTCTKDGIAKQVCVCGEVGYYYLVEAAHTWGEPYNVTAPTCDTKGAATHDCTVCGEKENYEIDALGHNKEMVVTQKPTCGATGSQIVTCLTCGKTFGEAESIQATGDHKFETVETVVDATCTAPASVFFKCENCDAKSGERTVGNALGHVDADGSEYRAPTCTLNALEACVCDRCGEDFNVVDLYQEFNGDETEKAALKALGHKYGAYSYTDKDKHSRTCSVCNYVEKTNHDYVGVVTTVATCQRKEVTTYTCKDCKHVKTAETAEKNPLVHEFGERVIKAPTCTDRGIGKYVCPCGEDDGYYVIYPAHTWGETEVITAATCTVNGEGTHTCTVCEFSEDVVITAPGHDMVEVVTSNATCGVAGSKTEYCKVCETEGETTEIPATEEHVWEDAETVVEATCLSNVKVYIACSVCGNAKEGTVHEIEDSKLPHVEATQNYAADCENNAREVVYCLDCNTELGRIDLYAASVTLGTPNAAYKAYGHDWSDYTFADGSHSRTCATCNKVETEDCDYEGVDVDATCNKVAHTVYTCVCGDSYEVETGTTFDSTKHNFAEVVVKPTTGCTVSGIAKSACVCGVVEGYYVLEASHTWGEDEVLSESEETVYKVCEVCDAALVVAYFGDEDVEIGLVVPHTNIESEITVNASVGTKVTLTIGVKADLSIYNNYWVEVNGEKITNSTVVSGVYTFTYTTGVDSMDDTFTVALKAAVAGIDCVGSTTTYSFDLVDEIPVVEAIATEKIEGASASFVGRGVSVGETVRIIYHVNTRLPEGARLVLKNKDDGRVYASFVIADELQVVNGVYVAEVEVAAADWNQVYAATICDAEGNALSNTNYYSIAQFAASKIVADANNELSNVLRAMMAYIAE